MLYLLLLPVPILKLLVQLLNCLWINPPWPSLLPPTQLFILSPGLLPSTLTGLQFPLLHPTPQSTPHTIQEHSL